MKTLTLSILSRPIALAIGIIAFGATAPFLLLSQTKVEVVTPNATQRLFYDGSNNVEYVCKASSAQSSFSWTRSASTLTSIADSTNTATVTTSTAHGLDNARGARVTISGATGDVDLNGTYLIQTTPSSTTFTITTANVTDATYNESTLVVSTTAPRTTAPVWAVQRLVYDVSNNLTSVAWAGSPQNYSNVCNNRTVLEFR